MPTRLEELEAELARLEGAAPAPNANFAGRDLASLEEELATLEETPEPNQPVPVSDVDLYRGNSGIRALRGAAAPITGPFQGGAYVGDKIYGGAVEAGKAVGAIDEDFERSSFHKTLQKEMNRQNESAQRGQEALGRGSFDAMGLLGAMTTGAGIAPTKLAPTLWGKTLQGAGYGATAGAAQPVYGDSEDFLASKAVQTGLGTAIGGAVPGAMTLGKMGVNKFMGTGVGRYLSDIFKTATDTPRKNAGRMLSEAVDGDTAGYAQRLEDAEPGLTVGQGQLQKTGGTYEGSRKLAGLGKFAAEVDDPDIAGRIFNKQFAESADELQRLGNPEKIKRLEALRDEITEPMREGALTRANEATTKAAALTGKMQQLNDDIAGTVQDGGKLAAEKTSAGVRARNDSIPGVGKIPARYSKHQDVLETIDPFIDDVKFIETLQKSSRDLVDYQLSSMGSKGITGNPILGKVSELMQSPAVKGNPVVRKALTMVIRNMKEMAEPDGTYSARVLYEFRKGGLDDLIERYAGADTNTAKNMVRQLAPLKGEIDDAIDSAAGGGWKEYLGTYTALSRELDQAKVAHELSKALSPASRNYGAAPPERSQVFTEMMRNPEEVIQKVTGFKAGAKTYEELFPEETMAILNKTADKVSMREEAARLADQGYTQAQAKLGDVGTGRFPNALVREIMMANAVLSRMGKNLQAKTLDELVQIMRDPKLAAQVLREASAAEKEAILSATKPGLSTALKQSMISGASAGIGKAGVEF